MDWQYRTILFEFQKDGLLGDKYVDDEEMEKILNEQGAQGWELVSVTTVQEGLLTFFKRGGMSSCAEHARPAQQPPAPGPPLHKRPAALSSMPEKSISEEKQVTLAPKKKSSMVGEIKIS